MWGITGCSDACIASCCVVHLEVSIAFEACEQGWVPLQTSWNFWLLGCLQSGSVSVRVNAGISLDHLSWRTAESIDGRITVITSDTDSVTGVEEPTPGSHIGAGSTWCFILVVCAGSDKNALSMNDFECPVATVGIALSAESDRVIVYAVWQSLKTVTLNADLVGLAGPSSE